MGILNSTFDANLQLHDGAAAVTADGAGQVSSAAKILDLGAAPVQGVVVVEVSAIDNTTGDESYLLHVRGSTAADMATAKKGLASRLLGGATVVAAQSDSAQLTGRFLIPFINVDEAGNVMRYVQLYFDVGGTTPSITCKAYIVKTALLA